ncbi:kelch-like protein 2 [Acyrthosiphon pisum]|uniref:Uncharacterized protein n=1 Tax=Acyrthosiphon pisum TaxID=7029 RepID=A0A8R2JMM4_ACYPI|nr:kelch-like protein 2 [Acyrthosiphon pisum]|eukprot:XP_008185435.1 PREDICTED: kelch-like protein 2 [Acyrthosiphon pisum]
MAHVRLPLTSKDYILKHVVTEPLLNNCPKCKDYVIEALHLYLLKSDEIFAMPHNIRTKPRQSGGSHKIILVVARKELNGKQLDSSEWYDPKINQWQTGPKMITPRCSGGLAVVKDNFVLYIGGCNQFYSSLRSADLIDLSSESLSWKPTTNMLVQRKWLGVGVINNFVYAVGGYDYNRWPLKSAEVFDCRTQEWHMVASMSIERHSFGVGVLNNILYAVGGSNSVHKLNSVECYHPGLDKWTPVEEMSVRRSGVGVGVLHDVLYAVGGWDGNQVCSSVEAYSPSTGVWTNIPDMHLCRSSAGVAVLDGLLYVIEGWDGTSYLDSVESYNPKTNKWTMVTASMKIARNFVEVVVIERPRHLKKWNQSCFSFLIKYINIYSIISFCTIVSLFFFYLFSSF